VSVLTWRRLQPIRLKFASSRRVPEQDQFDVLRVRSRSSFRGMQRIT
jgi:hypothetical protein